MFEINEPIKWLENRYDSIEAHAQMVLRKERVSSRVATIMAVQLHYSDIHVIRPMFEVFDNEYKSYS